MGFGGEMSTLDIEVRPLSGTLVTVVKTMNYWLTVIIHDRVLILSCYNYVTIVQSLL